MTRIYLVRHAQSEGNFYRRAHGMYNSMLTPQGRIQLEVLLDYQGSDLSVTLTV